MPKIQDPKIAGLIASANHALRDALGPFVERTLRATDGEKWLEVHNARREDAGADKLREEDGKVLWDSYGVIRSLDIEFGPVFRQAFLDRGCDAKYVQSVVVQLVSMRNFLIAHPTDLVANTRALLFLTQCYELFEAIKNRQYAHLVRDLLDQFRSLLVTNLADQNVSDFVLSNDEELTGNKYTKDEIPENERDLILKQLFESLAERGWRLDAAQRGPRAWGCTSAAFNLMLLCDTPKFALNVLDEPWYAYEHSRDNLRIFVLGQIKRGSGDFRNDPKVRIASDFFEPGSFSVDIQETDYLSSAMTDQLRWARVRSKRVSADGQPSEVLWDGVYEFVDQDRERRTAKLKGFKDSSISNQAAGSTFAFSNDGHLMIVAQNDKNRESINMLAPSGSGSFDWSDVALSGAGDLLRLVEFATGRELREECALNEAGGLECIAARIKVFAFGRMLHRAGKPEFFCLGRINADAGEITKRRRERYVQRVLASNRVQPADWKVHRPSEEIWRVCLEILDKSFVDKFGRGIPLSYPLEHGLRLLAECCEDTRGAEAVDRFISEEFSAADHVKRFGA